MSLNLKNMAAHNDKGAKSEKIAQEFLKNKKYSIRHTNWRNGIEEIDIIAINNEKIIIVEVKSLKEKNFSNPSEVLGVKKMKHLVNAAEAYIIQYDLMMEVRFDLVLIIYSEKKGIRIEHIESIFLPGVNW